MNCEEKFREIYGKDSEAVAFCPMRVAPLGAHIDHQNGSINALALDKGIRIAYRTKHNGVVEVQSLQFSGKRAQFHVASVPEKKENDFADHLRGAAKELGEKYPLRFGISAVIEGELPIGGLSSSAAVIIAFLTALATVNGVKLGEWEAIMMAKAAENNYVGVNCGKLDQCAEVLSKKDHLLYLDCLDDSYHLIPWSGPDYSIAIFFSGLERSLANSAYNLRQDECKAAAYSLLAYAGLEYGKFKDTVLRDVPLPVFEQYCERLPENFRKRAKHFFTEFNRAQRGAEAWKNGDLAAYGTMMFESGRSSIENYECGCPELISIYEIMTNTPGIYGGRFSGAGFKGCCVALVEPEFASDILEKVEREYLKLYPHLEGKYQGIICHSADGVDLGGGLRR